MSMKNSNGTIGNRTRDLPGCAVPQPTVPQSYTRYFNRYKLLPCTYEESNSFITFHPAGRHVETGKIFKTQFTQFSKQFTQFSKHSSHDFQNTVHTIFKTHFTQFSKHNSHDFQNTVHKIFKTHFTLFSKHNSHDF
jgi:hypothetical protein